MNVKLVRLLRVHAVVGCFGVACWLSGWLRIRVFGGSVFRVKGVCFGGVGFGFRLKGVGVAV
jgi:hypothetical protein